MARDRYTTDTPDIELVDSSCGVVVNLALNKNNISTTLPHHRGTHKDR